MKTILLTFIVTLTTVTTVAFAGEGGNGSGGGNVCEISSGRFVSLEEANSNAIAPFTRGELLPVQELTRSGSATLGRVEIEKSQVWQAAIQRINAISYDSRAVRSALLQISARFKYALEISGVKPMVSLKAFFAAGSGCNERNSVAAIGSNNNHIIYFRDLWKNLSFGTQTVLTIHEILRVGQVKYEIFARDEDRSLQEVAMRIYEGRTQRLMNEPLFQNAKFTAVTDPTLSAVKEIEGMTQFNRAKIANVCEVSRLISDVSPACTIAEQLLKFTAANSATATRVKFKSLMSELISEIQTLKRTAYENQNYEAHDTLANVLASLLNLEHSAVQLVIGSALSGEATPLSPTLDQSIKDFYIDLLSEKN